MEELGVVGAALAFVLNESPERAGVAPHFAHHPRNNAMQWTYHCG